MNTRIILSSAAFAAALAAGTANATEMCYGSRVAPVNTPPYYWNVPGNWLDHNNTGTTLNALPTAADDVHIWGGIFAANTADAGNPLIVSNGTAAVTKAFSVGHSKGATRKILFEVQGGGSLTTHGAAVIGNDPDNNSGGLVTLRSGSTWSALAGVTVGASKGNRNRIVVEYGATMTQTGGEFIVGNVKGYSGIVTNRGDMSVYDLFTGGNGNGTFANAGNLVFNRKFTVGRNAGSVGTFVHLGGTITNATKLQHFFIGHNGTGTFQVEGPLALDNDTFFVGSSATGVGTLAVDGALSGVAQIRLGHVSGARGTMTIGPSGLVDGIATNQIGNVSGAIGELEMSGGELRLLAKNDANYYSLFVGQIANGAQTGFGSIRGYGKIGSTVFHGGAGHVRMQLAGQAVADGGDLDFGAIRTVGSTAEANACGTNGWYAVNGGRLIYPRMQNFTTANHVCIGEYVFDGTDYSAAAKAKDITLVNSFQMRLYGANGAQLADNKFNFAALYAPDRADIPGASTLPGSGNSAGEATLGVWRIGHFADTGDVGAAPQNPVAFGTASLRFRFDDTSFANVADWDGLSIGLYRWDGAAWRRVARIQGRPASPYVEAAGLAPYTADPNDNWNVGWFAVAVVREKPFVMVVR